MEELFLKVTSQKNSGENPRSDILSKFYRSTSFARVHFHRFSRLKRTSDYTVGMGPFCCNKENEQLLEKFSIRKVLYRLDWELFFSN